MARGLGKRSHPTLYIIVNVDSSLAAEKATPSPYTVSIVMDRELLSAVLFHLSLSLYLVHLSSIPLWWRLPLMAILKNRQENQWQHRNRDLGFGKAHYINSRTIVFFCM